MKKHSTGRSRKEQEWTIGVDLGDRNSRYCVLDQQGEVVMERSVATTKKGLAQAFGAMRGCRMALEVGTHSPWVSRVLRSWGQEVIAGNARRVRLITDSSRKNDKLDARTLARLARIDPQLLSPVQHRRAEAQMDLLANRALGSGGVADADGECGAGAGEVAGGAAVELQCGAPRAGGVGGHAGRSTGGAGAAAGRGGNLARVDPRL